MELLKTLESAMGWMELGLADEALAELKELSASDQARRAVLDLRLLAEMECKDWNSAADTARLLCLKDPTEAEYFIKAAYCLHETGDTPAACSTLLRGPKALFEMALFHYNLACYLWTLGEGNRARSHLSKAFSLDESLREFAKTDRDLAGIGVLPECAE